MASIYTAAAVSNKQDYRFEETPQGRYDNIEITKQFTIDLI